LRPKKKLFIEKIVHQGYGLARYQKKVFFLPYTLEGETVDYKIVEKKKSYTFAFPLAIFSPSPYRIKPLCPFFKKCGGCDFQHVVYTHQIEIKKSIIQDFINKYKIRFKGPIEFLPSPEPFNYRINVKFKVRNNKVGFYQKYSNEFVPINKCLLLDENINSFIDSVTSFPDIDTLIVKIDNNNNNISSNIKKGRLTFIIDDLKFFYDYRVFFQSNKFLIKKWLDVIAEFIEPFSKKRVIDIYCGSGIISLYLTKKFKIKKITGIEKDNTAINFARLSREANKLFNIKFICKKAEKGLEAFESANIIILNPPRQGASREVLKKIIALHPQAIVYSSCEISTFIRDAVRFIDKGYHLEKITALDMFPQTYHFETVGLFTL